MAHVEFTYTGASPATLNASARPFHCFGFVGLYDVGPSRGSDFTAYGTDGVTARDRERDLLAVELLWDVSGEKNIAGTAASDVFQQMRHNIRALAGWFDAAPGKRVTVRLVDGTVWEADAAHEEWGVIEWHGLFVRRRQLLTVAAGALDEESS